VRDSSGNCSRAECTSQGFLKVTATAPISVTGVRGRYNERKDFLITTTPPRNEDMILRSPARCSRTLSAVEDTRPVRHLRTIQFRQTLVQFSELIAGILGEYSY